MSDGNIPGLVICCWRKYVGHLQELTKKGLHWMMSICRQYVEDTTFKIQFKSNLGNLSIDRVYCFFHYDSSCNHHIHSIHSTNYTLLFYKMNQYIIVIIVGTYKYDGTREWKYVFWLVQVFGQIFTMFGQSIYIVRFIIKWSKFVCLFLIC